MDEKKWLAERFEENRTHLRAVAYRMLGSLSEAEDAVQESWLHISRADTGEVQNLGGWLTMVVARVCLDMLRSRQSRREDPQGAQVPELLVSREDGTDPEQELLLADSVGLALLVVLEALPPAERIAFVLHDLFAVSFDEIAPIVGRSSTAARQLASRARRRVQGADTIPGAEITRQKEVVEAFLAASRGGDLDALLAVLDPDVVVRSDSRASPSGAPLEIRGAQNVARQALAAQAGRARFARMALVNGAVGVVVAPRGRLLLVLDFKVEHGKVVELNVMGDPAHLRQLDLSVLDT